jgi:Co/Zn/Cd efflux system component
MSTTAPLCELCVERSVHLQSFVFSVKETALILLQTTPKYMNLHEMKEKLLKVSSTNELFDDK